MLSRLEQLLNADLPIDVTLSGMVMLLRLVQLWNAQSPIEVTLSSIVMLVRLVQPLNALAPIEVTGMLLYLMGIIKDAIAVVSQSDTLYSVPSPFRVKVRSLTEAACKDATSKGSMSRVLSLIPTANEIFTLRSTRISSSVTARD